MLLAVTSSEITKTQKREKASEEMVCTTLEPVEAEEGQTGNAQEEMQCYKADQSQFLRLLSSQLVVAFLGKCASGYGAGYAAMRRTRCNFDR